MWSVVLPILILSTSVWAKDPPSPTDGDNWVLLDGKGSSMSGSTADVKAARALQKNGEPLLFFRRGARAFVVRDAAIVDRVRAAWAPTNELGKRMDAIGKKMGVVGDQQRALGDRMGAIGDKMGEVGTKLGRRALDDRERARLEKELDRLSAELEPLNAQMRVLSKAMQPFSDEMTKLGAEMERLADKGRADTAAIIDDALARGLAVEVK